MTEANRKSRATGTKGNLRARKAAGLSVLAITGLFATYMQALRSPSAYATTSCNVTLGSDNPSTPAPGSLRGCINEIESAGGGTITFGVTSLTLLDALPDTSVDFSLDGGTDGVTISGGGPTSNFRMLDAHLNHKSLAISHVTFKDFHSTGLDGSVLRVLETYSTIAFTDVTILDTYTDGVGAVFWNNGDATATISDSSFSGNTSEYGVLNFNNDVQLSITNSEFVDNYGTSGAGALFVYGGDVTITNSEFAQNGTPGYGGAIYLYEVDTMSITDSKFVGNSASYGGAIYDECCTVITVTGSLFDGNSAVTSGGVLYKADGFYVDNSTFINNRASVGAVLTVSSAVSFTNVYMGRNTATSESIVQTAGDVTMEFVTMANNTVPLSQGTVAMVGGKTLQTTASVITATVGDACDLNSATVTDSYTVSSDSTCSLTSPSSVEDATPADLDFGLSPEVIEVPGIDQTVLPVDLASILLTGAPTSDLSTGVTTDQVGSPRSGTWTIGSRQFGYNPAAPTALQATPGVEEASVAFSPGSAGSQPITNYEYTLDEGATWLALNPAVVISPVVIPGLENGVTYTLQLRAVTSYGRSPWSSSVTVTPGTSGEAPNRPQRPEVLTRNGKVTVSVSRGVGGGSPTRFLVTASPRGGTCVVRTSTAGSCVINGLSNGSIYTFTAVASNAQGTSGPSVTSEQAQPGEIKKPSAQSLTRFLRRGQSTLAEGGTTLRLVVGPNAGGKGLVIAGENFVMGLDGLGANGKPMNLGADGVLVLANERDVVTSGVGFLPKSEVDLYVDPSVREDQNARSVRKPTSAIYVGTVSVNADGTFEGLATLPGGISHGTHDLQAVGVTRGNLLRVMSLGVYVTSRPEAVRDLMVDSTSSSGSAALSWKAPARSQIAGVDHYLVGYRPAWTNDFVLSGRSADADFVVDGLLAGCPYVFRVQAVNGAGKGPWGYTDVTYIPALDPRSKAPRGEFTCLVG